MSSEKPADLRYANNEERRFALAHLRWLAEARIGARANRLRPTARMPSPKRAASGSVRMSSRWSATPPSAWAADTYGRSEVRRRRRARAVPRVGQPEAEGLRAEHGQRPVRPGSTRLHRASCFTLEPGFGGGTRQTADYIKVCSPDPKELNEWAVGNLGYGLRSLRCQHCEPTSLGLTD